jgi:subtilisin family serine protease
MEKEYSVIAVSREHLPDLEAEITASSGEGPIPSRSVNIANARPGSKIQTHFMLTDEEAEALRLDSRVRAVEEPPENRDDIQIGLNASQNNIFYRGDNSATANVNWGLRRCIESTNVYASSTTTAGEYTYSLTGKGVDIVIQDSGVDVNHPEWNDDNGISRFQVIDWYQASGISGTQDASFYDDYDGHGTHCAGIAAGRTYGWAKDAHIYAQKLGGLEGTDDPGNGIPISTSFDTIRLWHNAKTNGRPTVVNMSWGYSTSYTSDPTGGTYRGTPWTFVAQEDTELWDDYGIVAPYNGSNGNDDFRKIPSQVAVVDAEVEDMINDGIHVCIAAGNDYYKADLPAGADYDNTAVFNGSTRFYHRPGSPYSAAAFNVGNIDSAVTSSVDKTSGSSKKGPAVNFWAPGTDIQSTCSINYNTSKFTALDYPQDTNFNIMSISGTSMAAPQVAGVLALYLESRPNLTPAQLTEIMIADSKSVINETANNDSDYRAFTTSIMGSYNRMMYSKYSQLNPYTITTQVVPQTTYSISVTSSGSSNYVLTGSDINGSFNAQNDPTIEVYQGNVLEFTLSVSGHPFWIKTAAVTGTGSTVTSGVIRNGFESGVCTWDTTGVAPGTYYYICEFHGSMVGQIIISSEE